MVKFDPELAAAFLILVGVPLLVMLGLFALLAVAEWLCDRRQNFKSHPIHGGNMRRRDR